MQIQPPEEKTLKEMMGAAYGTWQALLEWIEGQYEMQTQWATGGKAGPYEYKYRRGGKTLCALYPGQGSFGFMVVLGRAEQAALEQQAAAFDPQVLAAYEQTRVYHDGRWLMLKISDERWMPDMQRLLHIKRRPNKK